MIYASVGMLLVAFGFWILLPTWNLTGNAINAAAQISVTNATYLASVNAIGSDLNTILGYGILSMGVGIWVYLLLFAWRRQTITDTIEADAY